MTRPHPPGTEILAERAGRRLAATNLVAHLFGMLAIAPIASCRGQTTCRGYRESSPPFGIVVVEPASGGTHYEPSPPDRLVDHSSPTPLPSCGSIAALANDTLIEVVRGRVIGPTSSGSAAACYVAATLRWNDVVLDEERDNGAFGSDTLLTASHGQVALSDTCVVGVSISVSDTGGGTVLLYGAGSPFGVSPAVLSRLVLISPDTCPELVPPGTNGLYGGSDVYHAYYVRSASDVDGGT